ncbi:MAG TPA: hypothetical protein VF897_01125 [Roseiflexaceae bacterium]
MWRNNWECPGACPRTAGWAPTGARWRVPDVGGGISIGIEPTMGLLPARDRQRTGGAVLAP